MKLSQKAETMLDLPAGALTGEARMELEGRRRLAVDGSCEILEYDESTVRLRTVSGEVCIRGDALQLQSLYAGGAAVSGRLLTIEFS